MIGSLTLFSPSTKLTAPAQNLLGPLRADVASYVPASDPYSYPPIEGLAERDLHRAFAYAEEIEIMQPVRRKSMALLGGAQTQHQGRRSLKITQVGILARKGMCYYVFWSL